MMIKNARSSPVGLYVIGITALFLAGFLMLVIFGAQTYRHTVGVQSANNRARATLSYISAAVRASDAAGAVEVSDAGLVDGTATRVLSLSDGDSGYQLRIYQSGDSLIEEYARSDAPLDPSAGSVVGETEVYEVEMEGGLLRVTTDDGSILLHLRSR